jgi:hypothetical protein
MTVARIIPDKTSPTVMGVKLTGVAHGHVPHGSMGGTKVSTGATKCRKCHSTTEQCTS